MNSKKYEFCKSEAKAINGRTLFRIRALVDIHLHRVKAGDYGGFLEKEENLSHEGNAWVAGDSAVYGSGMISRNALVSGKAVVSNSDVYGDVTIEASAQVSHSRIKGKGLNIMGNAVVSDVDIEVDAGLISGKTTLKNIFGRNKLSLFVMQDQAQVIGRLDQKMIIGGDIITISGNATIESAKAILGAKITISDHVSVGEDVTIHGKGITLSDFARISGEVTLRDNLSVSEIAEICSLNGKSQLGGMRISGDSVVDACSL